MDDTIQNQSGSSPWNKLIRSNQASSADTLCHCEKNQTPAICPLSVFQQTKSILKLLLAASAPESATRTHATAQISGGSNRSHRAFAQPTNVAAQSQPVDRASASVSRHDARWTTLCRPNQRKPAHQTSVSYVLLPLGGIIKKTLRQCVVYKLRGRGFSSRSGCRFNLCRSYTTMIASRVKMSSPSFE